MALIKFVSGAKAKGRVIDISARSARLDPELIAKAFGGKIVASTKGMDVFAVREAMTQMLQSSGGRPALQGTVSQVKIPKIAADWQKLEELSLSASDLKHKPSVGQMAAMVLHLALGRISEQELQEAMRKEFA